MDNSLRSNYESEKTQDILSETWKEAKLFIMIVIIDDKKIIILSSASGKSRFLGDKNQEAVYLKCGCLVVLLEGGDVSSWLPLGEELIRWQR